MFARAAIAKFHKLIDLDKRIYFLTVLEARHPRSICWSKTSLRQNVDKSVC